MNIQDMLNEQNILFDSSIDTKKELFEKLAQSLLDSHYISDKEQFIHDLNTRESQTSTGIQEGFGIPHAKSSAVVEATLAFAQVGEIKDYYGLDDQRIHTVFMIAVPENSNDVHLELLSSLARKLMNEDFKKKVNSAKTVDALYQALV